jgi:hypothetical protein
LFFLLSLTLALTTFSLIDGIQFANEADQGSFGADITSDHTDSDDGKYANAC